MKTLHFIKTNPLSMVFIVQTMVVHSLPQMEIDKYKSSIRKLNNLVNMNEAALILQRYGYLPRSLNFESTLNSVDSMTYAEYPLLLPNALTSPTMSTSTISEALRKFQIFYRLPVTGKLDHDTVEIMNKPRCGNPDLNPNPYEKSNAGYLKRYRRYLIGDDKMRWSKSKLTWQIQRYPTHLLTRARTHAVIQHAFNLWSRVINLDFVEEKDYYKPADIVIKFGSGKHGDSIPFDGEGGVLAHAYYPTPDNVYSFSGDAHFDDDEFWNDGPHKRYHNLVSVAVHELGHSLGLGHSSVPTAVMYPYYRKVWKDIDLDPDDIMGIQKIYGPSLPGKFIPPEAGLPDILPPPTATTEAPDTTKIIDYCNTSVDAIIKIRNLEFYIFKGEWQWRVTWSKTVANWISYQFRDGPAKIVYYWPALPKFVDYVDGGIERNDSAIYLFRGRRFWLLADNMNMIPGFPNDGLPLTALGLPSTLEHVDTVFSWSVNKFIYIFAGKYYWKLNENAGKFGQVHGGPDYPRLIENTWQGIPVPVQSAFTGIHGELLFFHGKNYFVFDNIEMHTSPGYPRPAQLNILGCTG